MLRACTRSAVLRDLVSCGLVFAAAFAPVACTSNDSASAKDTTRVLTPADFANTATPQPSDSRPSAAKVNAKPVPSTPAPQASTAQPKRLPATLELGAAPKEPADPPADQPAPAEPAPRLIATPGMPAPTAAAQPIDEPIMIDALVGQINGKPVFASEILEPLHARLIALTDQTRSRADFRNNAGRLIREELRRRIEQELALSEARRGLTPEQRTGLFYFISEIRTSLVSQQKGSEVAADEALRQSQGRTLDEQARQVLERELIQNELRQRVMPRVQVTWRDIQNEYEREYDKYHPKSTAKLRMIQVVGPRPAAEGATPDDAVMTDYRERIALVSEALDMQTSFDDIASRPPNEFLRSSGGLMQRTFAGEYAAADFSSVPEINEAARKLTPGAWAGPITYTDKDDRRERTTWIFLEEIDQPKPVTLEEAQLEIEAALHEKRLQRELAKYLATLSSRGNVSDIEAMADSLTDIAVERYVPPSRK